MKSAYERSPQAQNGRPARRPPNAFVRMSPPDGDDGRVGARHPFVEWGSLFFAARRDRAAAGVALISRKIVEILSGPNGEQ